MTEQKELGELGDIFFFNQTPHKLYEIVGINPGPKEPRYLIQQENGAFILDGDEAQSWIAQGFYINKELLIVGLEYSWVSDTNTSIINGLEKAIRKIRKEIYD